MPIPATKVSKSCTAPARFKVPVITVLNKLGIKATLDKDGNLKLPDEPQVTVTDDKPEVGALKP